MIWATNSLGYTYNTDTASALLRGMGTPPAGCVLVWGGRGVGKSTFCLALAAKFRQLHGCYAYTSIVNCKVVMWSR